jgi:hypothetical protein
MYQMRQSTLSIDKWPYYEMEEYINLLNQRHEEEKKQRESQETSQGSQTPNFGNLSNLTKSFNPSSFNLPKM